MELFVVDGVQVFQKGVGNLMYTYVCKQDYLSLYKGLERTLSKFP